MQEYLVNRTKDNATGKKIAMIVAFKDFRDEEYFIPKEILEGAGVQIITASTSTGTALGVGGGEALVEEKISELKAQNFDGIIFVGGQGAYAFIDNADCHRIAQEAATNQKLLAAICIAPAILAKAGVLRGKRATVWSSSFDKSAVKILQDNGAIYEDKDVVVDGNIITAYGPDAAGTFGERILEILNT